VHINNIAIQYSAGLDPQRRGQQQASKASGVADRHFRRHPAAEAGSGQHRVFQMKLPRQIKIEIGQIINSPHPIGQRRPAEPRMMWRDDAMILRQRVEPGPVGL
jgi:hypothetical protein